MKRIYLLFLFSLILLPLTLSSGQILVEDFNYPVGDSLTGHIWTKHSGSGQTIFVESGNLTYAGYPSSGIGNDVNLQGGSGSREDVNVGIDSHYVNGATVYFSFLVSVDSASTTADYFIHIGNRTSPTSFTSFAARVFVQNDAGDLKFGISNTSTSQMGSSAFSFNTTYLIFVKYTINTGGADECKLWVFDTGVPIDEASAGTPEVTNNSTNGQDIINAIAMRQGSQAYSAIMDGIRVSTTWDNLVPVELTSFTATALNNSVALNWSTATETNNSGFELQRKDGPNDFTEIGFIPGFGTTAENKSYSFVDGNLATGNYTYRLKQIDFDGTFSYSNEVDVVISSPAQFELAQNFPNPFNPSTKINFNLAVDSKVSLKVFNIVGQEVATLINSNLVAGVNSINFDASKLNSGVYLYRLEATGIDGSNFVDIKKMTLIK
jgi:Secretion system C-terminal sorting domain